MFADVLISWKQNNGASAILNSMKLTSKMCTSMSNSCIIIIFLTPFNESYLTTTHIQIPYNPLQIPIHAPVTSLPDTRWKNLYSEKINQCKTSFHLPCTRWQIHSRHMSCPLAFWWAAPAEWCETEKDTLIKKMFHKVFILISCWDKAPIMLW